VKVTAKMAQAMATTITTGNKTTLTFQPMLSTNVEHLPQHSAAPFRRAMYITRKGNQEMATTTNIK